MNKTLRLIITIAFTAISSFSFAQKKVVISSEELQGNYNDVKRSNE